jgi:hypothetical protein
MTFPYISTIHSGGGIDTYIHGTDRKPQITQTREPSSDFFPKVATANSMQDAQIFQ